MAELAVWTMIGDTVYNARETLEPVGRSIKDTPEGWGLQLSVGGLPRIDKSLGLISSILSREDMQKLDTV